MTKINFFRICACVTLLIAGLILSYSTPPESIPEPEVVKVAKIVDPKQLACLAKNIYFEAGSEPLLGQAAVARVVMNRIRHGFGSNPCSVIYQSTVVQKESEDGETQKVKICQFSWVCEGKEDPKNNARYRQAKQVAYDVLAYDAYEDVVPKSTLFFHNVSVAPNWAYNSVKRIGNHIFYSKGKNKTKSTNESQLNNTNKGN